VFFSQALKSAQSYATVWLLFENNPGIPRHVLGVFSSLALAMEAPRVKELLGTGTWEERTPHLWIFQPAAGDDFYCSLEACQIDR
jgi:hypothetical protein